MGNITINWDTSLLFQVANPQFSEDPTFKKVRALDRTDADRYFSRWCWTLMYSYHPDSPYKNLPLKERIATAEEIYNEGKDILDSPSKEKALVLQGFKDYIVRLFTTPEERNLQSLLNKLDERSMFVDTTVFNKENAQLLDSVMLNTSKLHVEIAKVKQIIVEGNKSETRGGAVKSLSDSGVFDDVYNEE
jgi:hypothetical protein